ncbi:lactate 2-monooxygenase [Pseudoroseomonas wenyumeiae]|uniref:Lactate 2-monooxygenase n=1 Tax=Teichococcus wenyumeiae TaxID=2478470 RepID=A0A3A9JHU8_9PROT|nr:alpha-hydroxy-acid oxidizing protein [Pseudoroseomonas wenyumeiae]RKK04105.1 lactate 2-monooxygenase [Pseudoroseomonas wenyumeiae]RMI19661.1 lactate 2-monooxygenase [Pseudoroseomonas wenyumeiae]
MADPGRQNQARIFTGGFAGRRPLIPCAPEALERAALARMRGHAAAYVAGGAGLERSMAANRAAFDHYRILQRVLRDVSDRRLLVELFGRRLPLPLLLAPIGVLEMAQRRGDLAAARAAASEGLTFVTSSQSSAPLEEIAAACGEGPRWFQLYWSSSDALMRSFMRRAEAAGYEAIVLTLDTTQLGWRPRDLDRGYLPFLRGRGLANYVSDPVFRGLPPPNLAAAERPPLGLRSLPAGLELLCNWPGGMRQALASPRAVVQAVQRFIAVYSRPDLTWEHLPALRRATRLPILLKGILHPDDARRALDAGMDGIIVSNHGGRQVDGGVAALDMLPPVAEAVAGRVPVLFDSGIRTGADVIKALSLGARAVLLGRPYVYGLALAGEAGVRQVIRNFAAELDLTLALMGRRGLDELDASALAPALVPSLRGQSCG